MKTEVKEILIKDIKPYLNNPRKNESAIEVVAQSIKEFGFRYPILIDSKNIIISGHTRFEAAKKLGMKTIPAMKVTDLKDSQIKALRIMDNKSTEYAEWNDDKLKKEMEDLTKMSVELEVTGFTTEEINELFKELDKGPHLDLSEKKLKVTHNVTCPNCGHKFKHE